MGEDGYGFRFTVLGRYAARLKGNESHVTVNLSGGRGDHLIYCGTLTMSEGEWAAFVDALSPSLGGRLEIDDSSASSVEETAAQI
jgi:hypothetical protein